MTKTEDDALLSLANDLRVGCQRIARRIRFEGTTEVAPHQFSVLVRIRNRGPQTPTQLAERERVSTPSMTRTVNFLVSSRLVERIPHPTDGRQVLIELSDKGKSVVSRTLRARDSWMMQRLAGLPPEELAEARKAADLLLQLADSEAAERLPR